MTSYTDCESRGECDDRREELAEARAEIERLRAALQKIAENAVDVESAAFARGILLTDA